jgi:hypothetical protein
MTHFLIFCPTLRSKSINPQNPTKKQKKNQQNKIKKKLLMAFKICKQQRTAMPHKKN